ncbi:MAG: hypothetical protein ABSB22_25465 [Thermodesulfobacteriota bacterium]|jgi:hypothetical protein
MMKTSDTGQRCALFANGKQYGKEGKPPAGKWHQVNKDAVYKPGDYDDRHSPEEGMAT